MTTMLDQLLDVGEVLSRQIQMDDATFHAALAEGFQSHSPQYAANLSHEQWAAALLNWIASMAPMILERIGLPEEHTTTVVEIRGISDVSLGDQEP